MTTRTTPNVLGFEYFGVTGPAPETPADDAASCRRWAESLRQYAAGQDNPVAAAAARRSADEYDSRARRAGDGRTEERARRNGGQSWGQVFVHSDAWRNRRGSVSAGAVEVAGFLVEERAAITSGEFGASATIVAGVVDPAVSPIAARCSAVARTGNDINVIRWSGPLRPGEIAEEDLKPAAQMAPELVPFPLPYTGAYVGASRTILADEASVAQVIDTRLRRQLGLVVDDKISAALAADPGVPLVTSGDLAGAVMTATARLAADGWSGNVTVLVNPDDFVGLPAIVGDLFALLGPASAQRPLVLATSGLPAGSVVVADLQATVTVVTAGPAQLRSTDSHAGLFLRNEAILLAEQRIAPAVTDPGAAVRAAVTGATPEPGTAGMAAATTKAATPPKSRKS